MGSTHGGTHRVGIVGLGVISRQYLDTLSGVAGIEITAVADLDRARAEAAAAELPGARALTTDELVASGEVDTVLNLTIPAAHAEVALAAIAHGRHVFGEKPLAATLESAQRVVQAADAAGVRLGCAPDTVLGTGVQTARAVVDEGRIGQVVSANAVWISPGHEGWHPHPDFYYRPGGGPLLDMGPYYLTSLVQLLGPVEAVSGAASRARATRTIGSGPRAGERVEVEVDTHVAGVLHHRSGAISTITVSFDGVASQARPIEVHGVDGSLTVPDPNGFDGEVQLHTRDGGWHPVAPIAGYVGAGRGIGLVDFAAGHGRAGGDVGLHVLEVMTAIEVSARSGRREAIVSNPERPTVVPLTAHADWTGSRGEAP